MTHGDDREMVVLTQELLEGNIDRRVFLQRMVALGVSASVAAGLLESLTWSDAVAAPTESPKRGGTLRIAYTDEIPALDPHKSPSESSIRFFFLIHATLLKLDTHLKPVGDLAQSFKISNGGLKYTFILRPNLKFSNGLGADFGGCQGDLRTDPRSQNSGHREFVLRQYQGHPYAQCPYRDVRSLGAERSPHRLPDQQ